MGACCKWLSRDAHPPSPEEEHNKAELIPKLFPSEPSRHTSHDKQFTYFLGVFDLSACGAKLKLPEYADEAHPNFSYQKFHEVHREYYRLVKELGVYIECRRNPQHQLHLRIDQDRKKIEESRRLLGFERSRLPGCMVKLQVQGVLGSGVDEIAIMHHHSQHWSGKFQETITAKQLAAGPIYFEFVVPEIFSSSLRMIGKPRHLQLDMQLNDSFESGKITYCQVLRWGKEGEGVVARLQLFEGQEEEEVMRQMEELHSALMREFEGDIMMEKKVSNQELAQRLSRHRSSLHQQYNLNNNSMF